MDKKLSDFMDWTGIQSIIHSEADCPQNLLGPHMTENGVLVQMFVPDACEIILCLDSSGKEYPMEQADEAGYFAILLPGKEIPEYSCRITYK